jgi:predicted phage tail protein
MADLDPQIVGAGGGGFGGKGGGGGGGSVSSPTTAGDTIQTKSFARVLDLISEGEIEGLADGNKSIYLNDTPLLTTAGSNFLGVTVQVKRGTQDQKESGTSGLINGFSSIEEEFSVGQEIEAINNTTGYWKREWKEIPAGEFNIVSTNILEIDWINHGLTTGDKVFINFNKKNAPWDNLYTVLASGLTTDVFRVQIAPKTSGFPLTAAQATANKVENPKGEKIYVMRNRLKIEAVNTFTGSGTETAYIRFLQPSLNTDRTSSTLYTKTGTYNASYTVLASPAPTSSVFYIAWTDKPGALSAAAVDGGWIRISTGTYTKSGSTITVNRTSHGYLAGMKVELKFITGTLKNVTETFTVVTALTNSFTVTRVAGADTGGGTAYYVDVPLISGGITKTITDTEVDRVRLTMSCPSLQRITSNGSIAGSSFRYAIDAQLNGGAYQQVTDKLVKGKSSGGFQFAKEFVLKSLSGWNSTTIANNFPINIRLRRINEDSESPRVSNAFSWLSYTEIVDAKTIYPNSALVGIQIDAQQFNSIPKRTYLIKGIKVRIPSNATVDSTTGRITYAGTWTGSFAAATWCSDPAWILWDILTSRRYGFGEQILTAAEKASFDGNASRLDKWSFYAASQYANELVSTGLPSPKPSQEARFSCNVSIQSSEQAFDLVNKILGVFRSQAFWSGGGVTLTQDRPQDSSYVFGAANVIGGNFTYQGSDVRTRPTVIAVRYLDLDIRDTAVEIVEDADLIAKYGIQREEIEAFACTSQSQAARVGRWLLYSNQYETETISFAIAMESGVVLRPGMVIDINDPTRAGTRMSGRVSSATTTTVVIDKDRTISSGDTISVVLPTGLLETRTVSSYNSGTRTVTVSSAFSQAPQANTVWLLTSSILSPTSWRVLSVTENSEDGTFGVTALSYNNSKYAYVESGATLQKKNISVLNAIPDSPKSISYKEALYANNNKVFVQVTVSWEPVSGAVEYQFRYRVDDDNWVNLPNTAATQQDIFTAETGNYEVEITAVSVAGKKSIPANSNFTVVGKTAPPADIS